MTIECIETKETLDVNITELVSTCCDTAAALTTLFGGDKESAQIVSDGIIEYLCESISELTEKTAADVYEAIRNELMDEAEDTEER